MAMDWAIKRGIPYQSYPPDYAAYPERPRIAPLARNTTLVQLCTMVLAIWNGSSVGTKDTMTKAANAGKPLIVQRFNKDGFC